MRWVYLATAPDQLQAEMWRDLLVEEEVPALVRGGDMSSFLGVSAQPCRIMVADDRVERAREVLGERLNPEEQT